MTGHNRKYETWDKLALYVAGLAVTTLLTVQAGLSSNQVELTKELAATSQQNQVELTRVTTQMVSVIENQGYLQSTVGTIREQIIRLCERQKQLIPNSIGKCE